MTLDEFPTISAAVPTVHQACWPKTSYSAREPDPGSLVPNLLGSNVRVQFRDRRPRYLPVRSRVGVGGTLRLARREGNGTLVPVRASRRLGARTHRTTGRSYQVPGRTARVGRRLGRTRDTLSPMPRSRVAAACCARRRRSRSPPAAARRPRRSTRPVPCTTDGRAAGAYPDLEALVPRSSYRGAPPETLDSGRNCTADEPRLARVARASTRCASPAGPGRSVPSARVVLAVFRAKGLTRRDLAAFYAQSAAAASRTQITGRVDADDRRAAGAPARHRDQRDGSRPSSSGRRPTRTSSTWSSPTTCPTRGSRTPSTRSGAADAALPAPPRRRSGWSAVGPSRRCCCGTSRCSRTARARSRSSIGTSGAASARRGAVPSRR